jgi:hypothetical protein
MVLLWKAERDGSVFLLLHPVLPLLVAAATLLSCVGCFLVVGLPPGPVSADGTRLSFISQGLRLHCGVGTVVLGTSAHFVALTQYIVAAHIGRQDAALYVALEILGWYMVLAYENTGLPLHLVGLATFLFSTQLLHRLISRHPMYRSDYYTRFNTSAWLLALVFSVALPLSEVLQDDREQALATNVSVSLEYVLLCAFAAQNLCMAHGLGRLESIHLVFESH